MIVLDTHVLAWMTNDDRRLGRKSRALIDRHWPRGEVAASAMSFWEIALLCARNRLRLPLEVDQMRDQMIAAGLVELPVDGWVGIRAVSLGSLGSDPADRLIAASAIQHSATLMSADERLLEWNHPLVRQDARL